jgi:citrate lyase subunit gamma (acyl carrier protein)
MKLKVMGLAGTLESSDILITIFPKEKGTGRIIDLASPVKQQFGDQIIFTIKDVLDKYSIEDVLISVRDRGALDFTIRARTETAIMRSIKGA